MTMARQIIASQNAEIGQMTHWLHAWYGLIPATPPAECSPGASPAAEG